MKCEIILRLPSLSPRRFVEYKRPFLVEGEFVSDDRLPDDSKLFINLLNEKGDIIRHVHSACKYSRLDLFNPELKTYEDKDIDRSLLNKYGFSAIAIDEDGGGIDSAINKCWFSDTRFEAIITSASDVEYGSLMNYGFGFKDENGNSYQLLDKGIYYLEIILKGKDLDSYKKEKIEIGKRANQIICRFNPISHKERMIKWCDENNLAIIKDTLPGYLESYLGDWKYHKGILKMYHAADVCMYDDVKVKMFDYLIDETSTSYAVELGFLNERKLIEDEEMFEVYYYDIGEAKINDKEAKILKFNKDEYLHIYRIDILKDKQDDNIYYLDQRNVKDVLYQDYLINKDDYIAISGVIRPMQDEVLLDDKTNTYIYQKYPKYLRYSFNDLVKIREMNLERIEDESIGKSVYEFYNVFKLAELINNNEINIKIECLDANLNTTKASCFLKIVLK